jgi:hypothetical protein
LDPFWRGTMEDALPPIHHYNHKVFAIRRKIISKILGLVNSHWVDLHRNLPKIHFSNTDAFQLGYWRLLTSHEQTVIKAHPAQNSSCYLLLHLVSSTVIMQIYLILAMAIFSMAYDHNNFFS